jgi:ABC-2 type transport system permease protein
MKVNLYFLRVVFATLKYNFISFYRVFRAISFALRFFMPLLSIGTAWILYNKVFNGQISSEFGQLGYSDYLTFVVLGNAVFTYIYAGIFITGRIMFFARMQGVLDPLFMTPMPRLGYMVGAVLNGMVNSTFDFLVLIAVGLLFGIDLSTLNATIFLLGLFMTLIALFGLGLVMNGVTLTLRDQVNAANFLQTMFYAFSGVVVPVEMMPGWAQVISQFSPLTHGLRIIRGSLQEGAALSDFYPQFKSLLIISVVLILVGTLFLRTIERNLKQHSKLTVI